MKHVILFLVFTSFVIPLESQAQDQLFGDTLKKDTLAIRLQEAILMALEKNPTVTIQRLSPKIANTYSGEQASVYDPVLTISANKDETKLQRFLGSRPEPFEMTSERRQYDLSLTQALPTGTEISASTSISASISSIYSDQYTGDVGISVTQSLLQGFGIGYNLANLRKAKIDVEISLLELKGIAEQLVADVERSYWDVFLAKKELNIQQRSLELAEQQLRESEERVAVGRLPELELAAVHAEVATRQEAMIDAQSRYEQARLHLLFLLNPSSSTTWDINLLTLDQPFIPVDSLDDIQLHEQLALKYRPDLQQARLNLKKNNLEITRTRNGLLPRLDLFISLGRTTYAQSFNESTPELHSPFYDFSAGVAFEFPVLNRQSRAEYTRAKLSHEQLNLALLNMERLVQWDIRSAYIEVLRAKQQIKATQVALKLQEKKLIAEQEKFRVGKSTNFLVLQAQRDYVESQLDEARTVVAYLNALVELYLMESSLLERRGIQSQALSG